MARPPARRSVHVIGCLMALTALCAGLRPAAAGGTFPVAATAADTLPRGFHERVYEDGAGEHRYVLFVPQGEPPAEGWPVILFLHGAGERGTDCRKPLTVGLGPTVRRQAGTFPAVVVFPQCEDKSGPILTAWQSGSPDARRALAILARVEEEFPVDPKRRILTGWSMGGYGAWSLAAAHPQKWSAVLPLSGGGEPEWAGQLSGVRLWAVHGERDRVTPAGEDRAMIEAVREAGGDPFYTEIPGAGHQIASAVYDHPAVQDWLIRGAESGVDPASVTFEIDASQAGSSHDDSIPFVPALTIGRAMSLRIGNRALQELSQGMHDAVAEDVLQGALPDFNDVVEVGDRSYRIAFSGLTYDAALARVSLHAAGPDRLRVGLAVRDVRLRIRSIDVRERDFEGFAGPVEVVIGHRQPVWLNLDVRPGIGPEGLQLHLLRSGFEVADSNWYVADPGTVRAGGALLSEDHLRIAVVGGLYLRKERIEQEVLKAVPELLTELQQRADFDRLGELVAALWPLPVYHPRVRVTADSIAADRDGIAATFAVTVAAIDPARPPRDVPHVVAPGPAAAFLSPTDGLRLAMSPEIIGHVSQMFADSGEARIHAQDVPGRPFAELTRLSRLAELIPDLQRYSAAGAAVRTEFVLPERFVFRPTDEAAAISTAAQFAIDVPCLRLIVSVPDADSSRSAPAPDADGADTADAPAGTNEGVTPRFRPHAVIDFEIQQTAEVRVISPEQGESGFEFHWLDTGTVRASGRFSEDAEPVDRAIDAEGLADAFRDAWFSWTTAEGGGDVPLHELAVGSARMVPSGVGWLDERLGATFTPPATTIVNRFRRSVAYQVCGPFSAWSRLRELPRGQQHAYHVAYPLRVRLPEERCLPRKVPAGTVAEVTAGPGRTVQVSVETPESAQPDVARRR